MTQCRAEIRTYHLPDDERMRCMLSHGRGSSCSYEIFFLNPYSYWLQLRKYYYDPLNYLKFSEVPAMFIFMTVLYKV